MEDTLAGTLPRSGLDTEILNVVVYVNTRLGKYLYTLYFLSHALYQKHRAWVDWYSVMYYGNKVHIKDMCNGSRVIKYTPWGREG